MCSLEIMISKILRINIQMPYFYSFQKVILIKLFIKEVYYFINNLHFTFSL